MMARRTLALVLIGTGTLIAACQVGLPGISPLQTPTTPTAETATLIVEAKTATPSLVQTCGYQWARRPLPALSDRIQGLFDAAGLADVVVRAEAFGENCVLPDGSVERFLPMNTDIHLALPVDSIEDDATLGERLKSALEVIEDLPAEWLPGTGQIGYLGPVFSAGADERRMWFTNEQAQQALGDGLDGAELIQSLSSP